MFIRLYWVQYGFALTNQVDLFSICVSKKLFSSSEKFNYFAQILNRYACIVKRQIFVPVSLEVRMKSKQQKISDLYLTKIFMEILSDIDNQRNIDAERLKSAIKMF